MVLSGNIPTRGPIKIKNVRVIGADLVQTQVVRSYPAGSFAHQTMGIVLVVPRLRTHALFKVLDVRDLLRAA